LQSVWRFACLLDIVKRRYIQIIKRLCFFIMLPGLLKIRRYNGRLNRMLLNISREAGLFCRYLCFGLAQPEAVQDFILFDEYRQ